jgi:hypothetical protein
MNGDDLLTELAKQRREDDSSADPRWERLARGELSPAEDAELRAQAERDPEVALLYEAYRPLSADVKAKIVAHITSPATSQVTTEAKQSKGNVVSLRTWRRVAVIALPLAAAAAFLVWTNRPQPDVTASLDARYPTYALEASGGDRAQRSTHDTPAGPITLQRGSTLDLVLRPSTPSGAPVTVRAFLVQGADARAWTPPMQRSPDGAVRIAGSVGDLGIAAGTWDVVLAVGGADAVPTDPHVIATALGSPRTRLAWQLLTTRVTVTPN